MSFSRRTFVTGLASLSASMSGLTLLNGCNRNVPALQVKKARVGVLAVDTIPILWWQAFDARLRELGWIEGWNLSFEHRAAAGQYEHLPMLAAQLLEMKVDVIFARAGTEAAVVRRLTNTLPVVFANAADPVGSGVVESLPRPGSNATGLARLDDVISTKRLELFRDLVPGRTHLAVLWNGGAAQATATLVAGIRMAAANLGLQLLWLDLRATTELAPAIGGARSAGAEGVFLIADSVFTNNHVSIVQLTDQMQLPGSYTNRDFVTAGGLMAYTPSQVAMYRRAAEYVDKVLRGTEPAELPVELPTVFEFVVNTRTVQMLGLTLPSTLAAQVTEWVE
jgi:putative ABC transport system substrate-binding protein